MKHNRAQQTMVRARESGKDPNVKGTFKLSPTGRALFNLSSHIPWPLHHLSLSSSISIFSSSRRPSRRPSHGGLRGSCDQSLLRRSAVEESPRPRRLQSREPGGRDSAFRFLSRLESDLPEFLFFVSIIQSLELREKVNYPFLVDSLQCRMESERRKRLREGSQLLIRGFDSISSCLSHLSSTLTTTRQVNYEYCVSGRNRSSDGNATIFPIFFTFSGVKFLTYLYVI